MNNFRRTLREYCDSEMYPFHMPGHKRRLEGAYRYDVTEVPGLDNLGNPTGIIKELNEDVARCYDSRVSFFTVGGSTLGNLSAISAAADMGDTIIIARNCHRSVINAAILRRLRVVCVEVEMYNDKLYGAVSPGEIRRAVERLDEEGIVPRAVVITSPTYEGVMSDTAAIADYLRERGIALIVDSAHGAHLHFDEAFPDDDIRSADICVMSAHKTLAALNQAAIVHVNSDIIDYRDVWRYMKMYETSSPSYVIMDSMCQALELIDEKSLICDYVRHLSEFYSSVGVLTALSVEPRVPRRDMSKVIIYTGGYMTGYELSYHLRCNYSIETEMSTDSYVLAMTSMMDTREALLKLSDALIAIDSAIDTTKRREVVYNLIRPHTKYCEPYEAFASREYTPLDESVGRASSDAIVAYPPGVAIIMPGEVIQEADIDYIRSHPDEIEGLRDKGVIGTVTIPN